MTNPALTTTALYPIFETHIRHSLSSTALPETLSLSMYLWTMLHSTHWKDVKVGYRDAFSFLSAAISSSFAVSSKFMEALRVADIGLLMGSGEAPSIQQHLQDATNWLSCHSLSTSKIRRRVCSSEERTARRKGSLGAINCLKEYARSSAKYGGVLSSSVDTLDVPPSIYDFQKKYFEPGTPVLISNAIDHWPALRSPGSEGIDGCRRWADLEYLRQVAGNRIVPVETGIHYLHSTSGSNLTSISDFIDAHILKTESIPPTTGGVKGSGETSERCGYLAQHQLFEQIPELKKDIDIPDYCVVLQAVDTDCNEVNRGSMSTADEPKNIDGEHDHEHDDIIQQAWFGPIGTVSPLHHDPYYNLLAQVVGYKYVRLYAPTQTPYLYPRQAPLTNNSEIDLVLGYSLSISDQTAGPAPLTDECSVDDYFMEHFPLLCTASYSEVILRPGDMLYIPRHYWHFIIAIDEDTALNWSSTTQPLRRGDGGVFAGSTSVADLAATAPRSLAHPPTCDSRKRKINVDGKHVQCVEERCVEDVVHQGTGTVSDTIVTPEVEFSFSVSLWWGKRIVI